jgi:HK97 family phage major capsid protein
VSGIGTVSMGTNGLLPVNVDPWADAMALLGLANAQATAIVMHPRTWSSLIKIKEATGSVRPLLIDASGSPTQGVRPSIYGVPVFLSSQLSITETQGTSTDCSTSYVYQADQCVVVRRQDVEVELDRSRLFNTDQSEMRGKLRADLICPNAAAIVRIIGIRNV